jgi:hypothetical protein
MAVEAIENYVNENEPRLTGFIPRKPHFVSRVKRHVSQKNY